MIPSLWKTVWRFLKKLKIELPYGPAIPILSKYLEKMKTLIQKDTCTPKFIAALLTVDKTWKQPKCPSRDKKIKKTRYIHTMEYCLAIQKNELLPFAEDLDNIMLIEISQAEKDKHCIMSLYVESKNNTN